jgi:hypothetical protein
MSNADLGEGLKQAHAAQMERWDVHMQRWEMDVREAERRAWDAQRIAADFGKLGLQSLVLVNGGALVAVPPLMQWLSDTARLHIPADATWFVIGLLCAAVSIVVAYINFSSISATNSFYSVKRARELEAEYSARSLEKDATYTRATRYQQAFSVATTATAWVALFLAIASPARFAIGVYEFIGLASAHQAPLK